MANPPGVVTDPGRIKGGVVSLQSGGDRIAAYVATPNQQGNHPGIVVIQEAFGLVDHICDLARRFANIGYNACAPALYWRRGAPKNPDNMDDVRPVMFGLPDSEAVQDLEAAADYLRALPGATGKIGAIGFCSGGRHTLLFACSSRKVDAAIDCWGGFIIAPTRTRKPTRRGRRRRSTWSVSSTVRCSACSAPRTRTRRSRHRSRAEAARPGRRQGCHDQGVPEAGHAFLADYRPSYREGPAQELWGDIRSFFDKHLK